MSKRKQDDASSANAPKTARTSAKPEIDLNYPFWYTVSGSDVTPPLLQPTGPLYDNNGLLDVRVMAPLDTKNHAIAFNHDLTLIVDPSGRASVRVSPDGGIDTTSRGLAVRINPDGVITSGDEGISLNLDGETLWSKSPDKTIAVKLKPNGVIASNSEGIYLRYNASDLVTTANGLGLPVRPRYLSPYCTMESGDPTLMNFSAKVKSASNTDWPCSYYLFMANSSGMVNGNVIIMLDRSKIETPGPGIKSFIGFTFVITSDTSIPGSNHSNLSPDPIFFPNEASTKTFFAPNANLVKRGAEYDIPSDGQNWYVPQKERGLQTYFCPKGHLFQFTLSAAGCFPANVVQSATSSSNSRVFVMSFGINPTDSSPNWYDSNVNAGTLHTGPIPFSYYGTTPDYSDLNSEM
ncbi:fiber 2 [Aviadenovirus phalacrocoracidae]|uniref:Fiber 2 n=1 Tax=Aviadenovirus sp. TaxID=2217649 RepID=A0ABZ0T6A0_9ADEN|nr:fiber 2 [Aviadenovirus sp.]